MQWPVYVPWYISAPESAAAVTRSASMSGADGATSRAMHRPLSRLDTWMLPWHPCSVSSPAAAASEGCRIRQGSTLGLKAQQVAVAAATSDAR